MNNIDKLQKSINQLEEIVSNLVEERNALQAENKKLKEQQLTVDTIEKVFDKHTIIANSDILYRKDLAKGFNDCRDLCRIPYAKQILKVKELQEQLSNWLQLELDYNKRIKELEEALNTLMNEVFSGQASMSSYGYKKAQRAKIKDIENG